MPTRAPSSGVGIHACTCILHMDNMDMHMDMDMHHGHAPWTCTFFSCVAAVRDAAPEGFAAVKVTALGDPQLLARASSALLELQVE